MSGDHNMNQTDSGWRKRQIALDKKAENARELGLDYEPSKTVMDMAREAGFNVEQGFLLRITGIDEDLERFAALVRADERDECAKVCDDYDIKYDVNSCDTAEGIALEIRARGQA